MNENSTHSLRGEIQPARLKQFQDLMRGTKIRWLFSPYAMNPDLPEGKWFFGVDYTDCSPDEIKGFEQSWNRYEAPITETVRKPSLKVRLQQFLR